MGVGMAVFFLLVKFYLETILTGTFIGVCNYF